MARVDFFLTGTHLYLNEVNTLPGFTAISMYPRLWGVTGVPLEALCGQLVDIALSRAREKSPATTTRCGNLCRTSRRARLKSEHERDGFFAGVEDVRVVLSRLNFFGSRALDGPPERLARDRRTRVRLCAPTRDGGREVASDLDGELLAVPRLVCSADVEPVDADDEGYFAASLDFAARELAAQATQPTLRRMRRRRSPRCHIPV